MMGMKLKINGDVILDGPLYCINGFAGRDAGSIAQTKDMGVNGLRRIVPPHVKHDVGGLAPNPWQ